MKFRTAYTGVKRSVLNASNPYVETFVCVEPYAVDTESGECVNPTPYAVLIPGDKINIQEKIQSYARDCDLYTILERYAVSGDSTLINKRVASFADIVGIPDNKNDFNEFIQQHIDGLSKTNPEIAKAILDSKIDYNSLKSIIDEQIKKALVEKNVNGEVQDNG